MNRILHSRSPCANVLVRDVLTTLRHFACLIRFRDCYSEANHSAAWLVACEALAVSGERSAAAGCPEALPLLEVYAWCVDAAPEATSAFPALFEQLRVLDGFSPAGEDCPPSAQAVTP